MRGQYEKIKSGNKSHEGSVFGYRLPYDNHFWIYDSCDRGDRGYCYDGDTYVPDSGGGFSEPCGFGGAADP